MHRVRQAAVFIVITGLALLSAGCATAGSAPSFTFAPPAAPSPTGQPTSTPTASPSASAAALSPSPASGATVSLTEWKVTIGGTIKSGKTDLTTTNTGVAPHELLVFKSDLDPSAYPTDAAGDINMALGLVATGAGLGAEGSVPWWFVVPLLGAIIDVYQSLLLGINNAAEKPFFSPRGAT